MRVRPSAIIVKDDKVLTLKYTYPTGTVYGLPGGNLELGEELKTALERELQEEINITATLGEIKYVAEVLFEGVNTIHFVFECLSFEGEPTINPLETKAEEIEWLPLADLHNYILYPNVGKAISLPEPLVFLGVIDQPRC